MIIFNLGNDRIEGKNWEDCKKQMKKKMLLKSLFSEVPVFNMQLNHYEQWQKEERFKKTGIKELF
jgi:hypothetical protein|tara:strand:+ start:388 stop:582 length:195 start_codon:yes stop_codon:yes gene_type:complete